MHIKKSVLVLILLCAGSIILLVSSAGARHPLMVCPVKAASAKCVNQPVDPGKFSSWDMISQILWRTAA